MAAFWRSGDDNCCERYFKVGHSCLSGLCEGRVSILTLYGENVNFRCLSCTDLMNLLPPENNDRINYSSLSDIRGDLCNAHAALDSALDNAISFTENWRVIQSASSDATSIAPSDADDAPSDSDNEPEDSIKFFTGEPESDLDFIDGLKRKAGAILSDITSWKNRYQSLYRFVAEHRPQILAGPDFESWESQCDTCESAESFMFKLKAISDKIEFVRDHLQIEFNRSTTKSAIGSACG